MFGNVFAKPSIRGVVKLESGPYPLRGIRNCDLRAMHGVDENGSTRGRAYYAYCRRDFADTIVAVGSDM